jgi:hypothetical protein
VTAVLSIIAAFAVLMLPGALMGAALGLRGWVLVGSSPAVTVGATGVLVAWYGLVGITWSAATAGIGLVVLVLVAAAVTRPWRRTAPLSPVRYRLSHHVAIGGALALTASLGAVVVHRGTIGLTGIPQYWDAMFHANVVRFIAATGEADSSALAAIAQPANTEYYYPHTYHTLGALLFDAGMQPAQVVLNSISACFPAVFALSLVALLRVVLPRPVTVFAGALLAGTFASFPYDLIDFGPLLPLALGIAVAPAACALCVLLVRRPSIGIGAALVVTAVGLLTTHPAAAAGAALMMAFLLVAGAPEDRPWGHRRALVALAAAGGGALLVAFPSLRGVTGAAGSATAVDWPASATPGSAAGQLLFFNQDSASPQLLLAVLAAVGAAVALRSAAVRPFLLAAGVFLALFVLAAAYDTPLSARLTAIWWNDRWRLAAQFVVPAAVLAAVGLTWAKDRVMSGVDRLTARAGPRWRVPPRLAGITAPVVVAALVVLVAFGTHGGYRDHNANRVAVPYTDGPTVSAGEQAAYEELARLWDGGAVLNDPADGSPWAYALEGLPLVFKAPLTAPSDPEDFGPDRYTLLERFAEDFDDREVQAAVASLDVRWVLVGEGFASPNASRAPGLEDLQRVDGLELVWSNDVADIYRVERSVS